MCRRARSRLRCRACAQRRWCWRPLRCRWLRPQHGKLMDAMHKNKHPKEQALQDQTTHLLHFVRMTKQSPPQLIGLATRRLHIRPMMNPTYVADQPVVIPRAPGAPPQPRDAATHATPRHAKVAVAYSTTWKLSGTKTGTPPPVNLSLKRHNTITWCWDAQHRR